MKIVVAIIGLFLLLYLAAALALYLLQRKFIYYPTPEVGHQFTNKLVNLENGDSLKLVVGNEGLSEAVIYFGGNAESVAGTAGELITALHDKTVYLVNYRGYGGSAGLPTEKNLFKDAEIIFDSIAANHTKISVIGRSLGSGVACWLASQRPVHEMVLITPYDSILSIAKSTYPMFPVELLLKDPYRSIDYAASIDIPVLAILAQRDVVIPAENSRRLIEVFPGDVDVAVLPDTGHNDLQVSADFYPLISGFLN